MRTTILAVLALAIALATGCGGSSTLLNTPAIPAGAPLTADMGQHHGLVYLSTTNSAGFVAVLEIQNDNSVIGNTYVTAASAQKAIAGGYGQDVGTDRTGSIRGMLSYSDAAAKTHANMLVFTFQWDATGGDWSTPAATGWGYFDSNGNLVELAADSKATPAQMSGTWTKQ